MNFKKIENTDAATFFDTTHVHGWVRATISYGLFENQNLISAISFRTFGDNTFEIARFSTELHTRVRGGFSKLFKNAVADIKRRYPNVTTILSYADRDWSPNWKDTVYAKVGFQFHGDTGPMLWYTNFKKVFSRQKFQKHLLREMFPSIYDADLTEQEILGMAGIYPIYNSGNWKFTLLI